MNVLRAIRPRGLAPAQICYYVGRLGLLPLVRWHRRRLRGTTVVGITGSAGKTTTTRLLAAVLSGVGPVCASRNSANNARAVIKVARRINARHRFLVQEMAAWAPGTLRELAWALEPDVAVVTTVGWDHYRSFRGPDGAAREKVELVRAVPASGIVVLNADDTRVRAMAAQARGRVVLFGEAEDAEFRAEQISASWPDRLRFELVSGAGRIPVSTRLIGAHWVPSVLAALATAAELGLPQEEAALALERVEPEPFRMVEVDGGGGVAFLFDNFKAPVWTVWPALDVLGAARAARKIAVIGQLSDDPHRPREVYRRVIEYARGRADAVILLGRWAMSSIQRFADEDWVLAFEYVRDLHDYFEKELRPGDLVLLKGTISSDHSERLVLARRGLVRCWRAVCGKAIACQRCPQLSKPHAPSTKC